MAVASAAALPGCIDNFDSPTEINSPRVLAARTRIAGDEARATPRAGDEVTVEWLAVVPESATVDAGDAAPLLYTWGFVACEAGPAQTTAPICASEPFAAEVSPVPLSAAPTATFTVPAGIERILLRGVICAGGVPALAADGQSATCEGDGAETLLVLKYIPVAGEDDATNLHPSWDGAVILLGGELLEAAVPADLPREGCEPGAEAAGVPVLVRPGKKLKLELTPSAAARETYAGADGGETREFLELANYVTAKELERQFSFIDDDMPTAKLDWTLPPAADIPDGGLLVRFFFVMRDGREGTAWTDRAVCLVRAAAE